LKLGPDSDGKFGIHGGRFVAETLMPLILEVEKSYELAMKDQLFLDKLDMYRRDYIGRPSPLYLAERLTEHFGGAKIYLKRDELNHTGAHKINNVIGQILLAKKWEKIKLLLRLAPDNMVLQQQLHVHYSDLNAKYSWALLI
jgi:tryptophan synthase beta chain